MALNEKSAMFSAPTLRAAGSSKRAARWSSASACWPGV